MKKDTREARLALLARRQSGAFSLAQARQLGFARSTVYDRVAAGTWERSLPGVFALGGGERTRDQELWIAVLGVGGDAHLTHESSALLHGAEGLPERPVTLTVPHRSHHRLPGVFAHQIDDLRAAHRTVVRGLPVSSAARAVVELGATQSEAIVGRVADDLVRLRRTSFARISAVLAQIARPGKPGVERVARMLDARGDGYVPPASELERALFSALEAGGLPPPRRQVALPGRGPIRGLVDGAYLDAQIVLEADGRAWHMRQHAARLDRERDAQVVRAGWVPLRFVYEQIQHHPDEVCAVVEEARAVRLRQLRLAG
jgi:very-short-patch-repair endonuclease